MKNPTPGYSEFNEYPSTGNFIQIPCPILDLFHEHPSTGKFIYSMSNTGLIP